AGTGDDLGIGTRTDMGSIYSTMTEVTDVTQPENERRVSSGSDRPRNGGAVSPVAVSPVAVSPAVEEAGGAAPAVGQESRAVEEDPDFPTFEANAEALRDGTAEYEVTIDSEKLGMTVENVLERTVVRAAAPGGGAESAGVESGSLIVALGGQSTKDASHLEVIELLRLARRPLTLRLRRVGEERLVRLLLDLHTLLERDGGGFGGRDDTAVAGKRVSWASRRLADMGSLIENLAPLIDWGSEPVAAVEPQLLELLCVLLDADVDFYLSSAKYPQMLGGAVAAVLREVRVRVRIRIRIRVRIRVRARVRMEASTLLHRLALSNSICARGVCCGLVAQLYTLPPRPQQLQLRGILSRLMHDPFAGVRTEAIKAIGLLGTVADPSSTCWLLLLGERASMDFDLSVRRGSVDMLLHIGHVVSLPGGMMTLNDTLQMEGKSDMKPATSNRARYKELSDGGGRLRNQGQNAKANRSPNLHAANGKLLPIVKRLAKDKEWQVRVEVACRLDSLCLVLGEEQWSYVGLGILPQLLVDTDMDVRCEAIRCLPRLARTLLGFAMACVQGQGPATGLGQEAEDKNNCPTTDVEGTSAPSLPVSTCGGVGKEAQAPASPLAPAPAPDSPSPTPALPKDRAWQAGDEPEPLDSSKQGKGRWGMSALGDALGALGCSGNSDEVRLREGDESLREGRVGDGEGAGVGVVGGGGNVKGHGKGVSTSTADGVTRVKSGGASRSLEEACSDAKGEIFGALMPAAGRVVHDKEAEVRGTLAVALGETLHLMANFGEWAAAHGVTSATPSSASGCCCCCPCTTGGGSCNGNSSGSEILAGAGVTPEEAVNPRAVATTPRTTLTPNHVGADADHGTDHAVLSMAVAPGSAGATAALTLTSSTGVGSGNGGDGGGGGGLGTEAVPESGWPSSDGTEGGTAGGAGISGPVRGSDGKWTASHNTDPVHQEATSLATSSTMQGTTS
ncbi:unnamed protein product, partial [Discosporangium mesarthrocarpum]